MITKCKRIVLGILTAVPLLVSMPAHAASSLMTNFEPPAFTAGATVHNVAGWSSAGAAGSGCAAYDHRISSSTVPASFGLQSLRISSAVTSGCFGDQTFSASLSQEAGETEAQGGTLSTGTRQPYFEASWDFASATPDAYQPGLSVVASPDRGDGARMSWVQMKDSPAGLEINFYDYRTSAGFVQSNIATGLDRSIPHNIRITMQFIDGPQNDIVSVYVDGELRRTGTSWEDYFRDVEGNPSRTVDSILFRTSGEAAPATLGNGFLVDNLQLSSGPVPQTPQSKDQCKKNGWTMFNMPVFKNQGQCVSSTVKKS